VVVLFAFQRSPLRRAIIRRMRNFFSRCIDHRRCYERDKKVFERPRGAAGGRRDEEGGWTRRRRRRRCRRRRAVIFHSLASHLVYAIVVLDEQLSQFHSALGAATRT